MHWEKNLAHNLHTIWGHQTLQAQTGLVIYINLHVYRYTSSRLEYKPEEFNNCPINNFNIINHLFLASI